MRILVTGNLGYIGPVLVEALARDGHEVHGYDLGLFARHAMLPMPVVARQTTADIRDHDELSRAVGRCDAVVHLAAMSNDPLGELDAAVTTTVNLDATLDLIELAGDRPFVLYSSASVYGVSAEPCSETSAVRPVTLYSRLKVAGERAALSRPSALVVRNGTVHGPAPVLRGDLLLNAMVGSAVTTGEVLLLTAPSTMRPVIDVRDLAELTAGLIRRGATGLYNVASDNLSVGGAATLVARATGARVADRHDTADARDYAMDTSKLRALVDPWWRPRTLGASVLDLVAHYRDIGLTAHDVQSRRYHRIAQYLARSVPTTAPR